MKLRNKKTGKIGHLLNHGDGERLWIWTNRKSKPEYRYNSLAELTKEWCDYEEPKETWYIDCDGEVYEPTRLTQFDLDRMSNIGNLFETKEEAEKAVEKLKAWHKLMDYWGTEVLGWEIRDMPTGGNWQTVNVKFNVKTKKEPMELLDIVFGGEE